MQWSRRGGGIVAVSVHGVGSLRSGEEGLQGRSEEEAEAGIGIRVVEEEEVTY